MTHTEPPGQVTALFVAAKIALDITDTDEWANYYCTFLGISPSELDNHLTCASHFVNANLSLPIKAVK
ncbi:MAG: hypothetical protein ACPHUL_01110 [Marinomonas gallaica]